MTDQTFLFDRPVDAAPEEEVARPARRLAGVRPSQSEIRISICLDLREAETRWRAFAATADGTVFQTYDWLSIWLRHVGSLTGATPVVVIGSDAQDHTLFMLPLAIERAGMVRRLVWLGSDLCDYNGPLLAPEFTARVGRMFVPVWRDVLERIKSHPLLGYDIVHLTKMAELVGTQPNPFMRLPVGHNPSGAYRTVLTPEWESFCVSKRSSTTRGRDRRKRRRLADFGEVRFVTPTDEGEVVRTYETLSRQKVHQLRQMGAPNIFARPGWNDFYRAVASELAPRGIAHVSRLDIGNAWAAINLGLLYRGSYYHVLASYEDAEYSRFGPGMAHLHDLIRYAIEHECTVFDFTIGDEPYKREWCDAPIVLYDHVSIASWRGALAAAGIVARREIKRAIKQTPAIWNVVTKLRERAAALRKS